MEDKLNDNKFFFQFSPVSTGDWEAQIHADLKGCDYEKKLTWKTTEGFCAKPYYRAEDIKKINYLDVPPCRFPFIRGNKVNNHWEIRQDIDEPNPDKANKIAQNAISRGADAIAFNVKEVDCAEDMKTLLDGINLSKTSVHFISAASYPVSCNLFTGEIQRQGITASSLKGSFNFDPLSYYLLYGKFYDSQEDNFNDAVALLDNIIETLPQFKCITINGQYFHNAGSSIIQELAFSLASASEYLVKLTDKGISIDDLSPRIQFVYATGSNYFPEIAKFRAVRLLWAKIVEQFKPLHEASMQTHLHAVTSLWNKSVYDPHVNLLRNTTEAMSAIIGGCDSMTVNPFDCTYKKSDQFSEKISRNTQLILKEESYLDKVADPSAGSYYIETLTDSIAEAALKLFLDIEEKGGFIKASKLGFIKEEIGKTCQTRDMDIAMRRQIFVGTNQYPNPEEKMLDKIRPLTRLPQSGGLKQYRGAQTFESLRLSTEAYEKDGNKRPSVFLCNYGNVAMRKVRALFASNFFGCIGYTILDNTGFNTIEEGVIAAIESVAEIIVFCSSDDEYAELTKGACYSLKHSNPGIKLIVAGNPTSIMDQLQQARVDDFINARSNVLETLGKCQVMMGII